MAAKKVKRTVHRTVSKANPRSGGGAVAKASRGGKTPVSDDGTRVTVSITVNPDRFVEAFKSKRATPLILQFAAMMDEELAKRGAGSGHDVKHAVARDTVIARLLENLSEKEALGVVEALEGTNRLVFMELYKSYAKAAESKKKMAKSGAYGKKPKT